MNRHVLAACVAASVVLLPAASADARGVSTFEGSCGFSGTVRFEPPLTNTPSPGKGMAKGEGRCSGTLTRENGRRLRLDAARARYVARDRGEISCGAGTAVGGGYLEIRDEKIRFRLHERRAAAVAALELRGRGGGAATGEARVSEDEDPAQVARRCSGPGLRKVAVDFDITTAPAISG